MIQLGIDEGTYQRDRSVHDQQQQHRQQGDHPVGDEAQLEVGDNIYDKEGYDLGYQNIRQFQITELKTVIIVDNHDGKQNVNARQKILSLPCEGIKGAWLVAIVPDDIVGNGNKQNFDGSFQTADSAFQAVNLCFLHLCHSLISF